MNFPGTTAAPEQTTADYWAPNPPTTADGKCSGTSTGPVCITADASGLLNGGDTYQVIGSNEGPTGYTDAVAVADEAGSNAARALTVPFIRPNFPFKYIGIRYVAGGVLTGTFTFFINQMPLSVSLNG